MPKVLREYERQDFTELLNELQGSNEKNKVNVNNKKDRNVNVVDIAKRKRSSLIDNPKMLYAYSSKYKVLHDRDCPYVKDISDKEFCMSSMFIKDMRHCSACYRKSLIRNGVGDDRRRMVAYERFFNQLKVSNKDLYLLLIEHEAKLKWINNDIMQVHLKDDTWRIIRSAGQLELWHNNYICMDDLTRHFTDKFHKQNFCDFPTFHTLLMLMLNYSWECHVAKLEKKNENVVVVHESAEKVDVPLIHGNMFKQFIRKVKKLFKFKKKH